MPSSSYACNQYNLLLNELDFVSHGCGVLPVDIDIKPGSDPNSINCNNEKNTVAVAILTTDDFDATTWITRRSSSRGPVRPM